MNSTIGSIANRLKNASETRVGKRILKSLKLALTLMIVSYLSYQLYSIGWINLWSSLPQTPWFYVLWFVMYLQLPLIESLIYRGIWGISAAACMPALLRKKVLNQDVAGYSGEFYYYSWAGSYTGMSKSDIMGAIKDNNIASGFAATTASIITIGLLLLTGNIPLFKKISSFDLTHLLLFVLLLLILTFIVVYFRKAVLSLSSGHVLNIFGIHLIRNIGVFGLQVLQWWVVFPSAPLSVWATMLAIIVVTSRLPFIPAKDWAAAGAILGISGFLDAPESVIAGLLLVHAGLNHGANFLVFSLSSLWGHYQNAPERVRSTDTVQSSETKPSPYK